jgi:hypothetical protein
MQAYPSTGASSIRRIHQQWDRVKEGVLENTPTLTWAYTRTFKERGKRDIGNSIDIHGFSINPGGGMLFI